MDHPCVAVSGKKKVGKHQKRRQVVIGEEVAKASEKPTSTGKTA